MSFPVNFQGCFLLLILSLSACSSTPENNDPAWTKQPSRTVDNGYIVYLGSAEDMKSEKAQFKAEGQALEDLANECSLLPKGTRLEDRYSKKPQYATTAYVKVAVEFQDCEAGKKATDPESIRKVANVSFTQQLKRYQDLVETGELASADEVASVEPPQNIQPMPAQAAGQSSEVHFFVVRQYVAYQKESVVLAPPTAYAPNSPETQQFNQAVTPASQHIGTFEQQNPQLKTTPQSWSSIPNRPNLARPSNLATARPVRPAGGHELRPPPRPQQPHQGSNRGRNNERKSARGKGKGHRQKSENPEERPPEN